MREVTITFGAQFQGWSVEASDTRVAVTVFTGTVQIRTINHTPPAKDPDRVILIQIMVNLR